MRCKIGFWIRAACLVTCCGFVALPAMAQDVAVPVSSSDLMDLQSQCVGPESCTAAFDVLLRKLTFANPGVSPSRILGSVVAAVSAAYNNGAIVGPVAATIFTVAAAGAAARGLGPITVAILSAQAAVRAGDPINLDPIALGSASPT